MAQDSHKKSSHSKTKYVDLHVHTTASDGTFTPRQMVSIAAELGLSAIAITDHDTVSGIEDGLEVGKKLGLEVIPGIEFSTEINNESVHIVGLYIDHKNPELLKLTNESHNSRKNRAIKIIEKINKLDEGPKITIDEVKELSEGGIIGRPHIAEMLIKKGYVRTVNEAFEKYLRRGGPGYVPRFKLTPQEAVGFLVKIKALPILAHPGYITKKIDFEPFIKDLKKRGLVGIEVYYPSHSPEDTTYFKVIAKKYRLLESGGSDCHGQLNDGPFVGSLKIPYSVLAKIKKKYKIK